MPFEDQTGTIVRKICMACSREFAGNIGNCPHDGNQLVALPQDQWIGKRLADRFYIKEKLGTGGMGEVYLAWHELMERWVAIKMLKQSFVEDHMSVKRFQQEAKAASRLKHPNVITLYDFGVTNTGQPYMVMDYLVGLEASGNPTFREDPKYRARSLAQEIKRLGALPVERAIHIISQACQALDHAHRQGVIHRDVKPANIMIVPTEDDYDFVKVVDFGVAKLIPINQQGEEAQSLTQVGEVCGSPVYMSPEQCMGQALDSRADIYSMGVVLYECLTGRLPLVGKNMVETMSKHINENPPAFKSVRPDAFLPDKVEQVTMRALAKEPHNRQQSMAELSQDLEFSIPRAGQTPSLKAHELLPPPADKEGTPPWVIPAIAAGVVGIVGVSFVVFSMMTKHPEPKQPPAVQATTPVTAPLKPATQAATQQTTPKLNPDQPAVTTTTEPESAPPDEHEQPSTISASQHTHLAAHKPVVHTVHPKPVESASQRWNDLKALRSHDY